MPRLCSSSTDLTAVFKLNESPVKKHIEFEMHRKSKGNTHRGFFFSVSTVAIYIHTHGAL